MTDQRDGAWIGSLEQLCQTQFGVPPKVFLEALRASPNARGYILGSLSELLLRQRLEQEGYHVRRIKEKWTGEKLHHGDLYVSADGRRWYVVESKGLKSNAERWHKIRDVDPSPKGLAAWLQRKRRGELGEWWQRVPAERKQRILEAGTFNRARLLETHFVSGTAGRAKRQIATPRKSEFHMVALDLYLRTGSHEFIYAATANLTSPARFLDHLKQNYLVDVLVPDVDTVPTVPPP